MTKISRIKKRIEEITATNRNPLYSSNLYWSQKPYNVCDILIEELSEEGDVIFDPFLGSGVTLLEAVKKEYGRIGIGCEINEAPVFLVKTLLSLCQQDQFSILASSFLEKLHSLSDFYQTDCPVCKKKAAVTSVCFDKPSREAPIHIKAVNYTCSCTPKGCKPPDLIDYEKINQNPPIRCIDTSYQLIPNSKLAVYENETIQHIFTGRNFAVLDKILQIIGEYPAKDQKIFQYILMSVLHLCKITDKHANSQWPLWIPKVDCMEKNILILLEKKIKSFEKTVHYAKLHYTGSAQYRLFQKGSQYLTKKDIPDHSVKLIITDPPYLGQVAYSEYMQLYYPFFHFDINLADEIVVSSGKGREKNEEEYYHLLERVFGICSKKMMDGGTLCMYFHDSSLMVWDRLITILYKQQFRYISQMHIKKSKTIKNIISPQKSLMGDAILFFSKEKEPKPKTPKESLAEIEKNVVFFVRESLSKNGPQTTPELYDGGLMELLICNNWLHKLSKSYKSLVELFEKKFNWNKNSGKWENSQ